MSLDLAEVIGRVKFVSRVDVCSKIGGVTFNWNRDGKWDVFIYWVKDGSIVKVTEGPDSYLGPSFSPGGDMLAYSKDRDGDEMFQVIVRDMATGRERDITRDPSHYHVDPVFNPKGDMIVFTSNRGGRPAQLHVYVENGDIKEVTRWAEPMFYFDWISDSDIVYVRGFYDTQVRLVNVESGEDKLLLRFEGAETFLGGVDVESGKFLFYSNAGDWFDIGEYDVRRGEWKWIYKSESEKYSPEYVDDGIAFIEFSKGVEKLVKISRGEISIIDSNVDEFSYDKGLLAYVKSSSTTPSALIVNGNLVIDTTPEELKGLTVPAQVLSYQSFDGTAIETIVLKPEKWNGKAVVHVHGGPDAHFSDSWNSLSQLLAVKGYMVLAPNYRGSTGYGRRFLHLNDRDLGGGDLKDVVEAGKLALRMGAEKVYIVGASYGGYLTALAMVREPELWSGGVAIVGFYNWYTEYEREADYLKAYDSVKMDPKLFHDRSPIFHLDKLRAPILFIHGANDPRCPVDEVRQMAEELSKMGKPHELHIYPDEGHSVRREENRIDMYRRISNFLENLD